MKRLDVRLIKHFAAYLTKEVPQKILTLPEAMALELINRARRLRKAPQSYEGVILIRGLMSTPFCMSHLEAALQREGYVTYNWLHDPRLQAMDALAKLLGKFVARLRHPRLHFVTHSLGGLVLRAYFTSAVKGQWEREVKAGHFLPGRIVMIAPPNHGSLLADDLRDDPWYQRTLKLAGVALIGGPKAMHDRWVEPPWETGVIAGGTKNPQGFSKYFGEDNDGTVTVSSTRLEKPHDFAMVKCRHSLITAHPRTVALTRRFLQLGRFGAHKV